MSSEFPLSLGIKIQNPQTKKAIELIGLIDTGASATVLSEEICRSLDLPKLGEVTVVTAFGETECPVYRATIIAYGENVETDVITLPGHYSNQTLLGWNVLSQLPMERILADFKKSLPVLRGIESRWKSVFGPHKNRKEKGDALESFLEYILEQIKGTKVVFKDRRTETEEIDLVVCNETDNALNRTFGRYFMIECKNWTSSKVGSSEIRDFFVKVYKRKTEIKTGFIISTGTFTKDAIEEALQLSREVFIVLVDNSDLANFVRDSTRDSSDFFIDLYERKSLFPKFSKHMP